MYKSSDHMYKNSCVRIVRGYIPGVSLNQSLHQGFSMSLKLVYPNYRSPLVILTVTTHQRPFQYQ